MDDKKMSYEKLQSYTDEFVIMVLELLTTYGCLPTRLERERVSIEVIKFVAKYKQEAYPIPERNDMSLTEYYEKVLKPHHDKYGVYQNDGCCDSDVLDSRGDTSKARDVSVCCTGVRMGISRLARGTNGAVDSSSFGSDART